MNSRKMIVLTGIAGSLISMQPAVADVDNQYATEFKGVRSQACDKTFHQLEDACNDMICRDVLVNAWAECWRKSMNAELDNRLQKLKTTDITEFHAEMALQKSFNDATQQVCGKNCGEGGTMKGIPYNFCRVDAYKYRAAQAIEINKNQLSIPVSNLTVSQSGAQKTKETKKYDQFAQELCKLPKAVWKQGRPPVDCTQKGLQELNGYTFTDDVCDLS